MSNRHARPPSGRTNVNQSQPTKLPPASNNNSARERPMSGRPVTASAVRPQSSSSAFPSPSPNNNFHHSSPRHEYQPSPSHRGSEDHHHHHHSHHPGGHHDHHRPRTAGPSHPTAATANAIATDHPLGLRSAEEILQHLRRQKEGERAAKEDQEAAVLGDYNAFSLPRPSLHTAPLRTIFLDPAVNNFPPSRTRSELLQRIKASLLPHPSYDLDRDGYVSAEDLKLAKAFDYNHSGVLDADKRTVAKQILAEEFFQRHAAHLSAFGPSVGKRSARSNTSHLLSSAAFDTTFEKLRSIEHRLEATSSAPLRRCLQQDGEGTGEGTGSKYYTNRMDATAWTDFTRVPRSTWLGQGSVEHAGSRQRLLLTRQLQWKADFEGRMQTALLAKQQRQQAKLQANLGLGGGGEVSMVLVQPDYRRVNMITDLAKENS